MAFLMLLHEKMRLKREENKLTLKQLRAGNSLSRATKKKERRQKYYQRLEKNLENQYKRMQNSAKMYFNSLFGFGNDCFNPNSYMGGTGGTTASAMMILQQWNGHAPNAEYNPDLMQKFINGLIQPDKENTGKYILYTGKVVDGKPQVDNNSDNLLKDFNKDLYQSILYQANQQVSMMRSQCENQKMMYSDNLSIWYEVQKEQLEDQQEMELDLLADEENDYELEKTSIETQLELIKQRRESIDQALGEAIKDSAPKFGLA